MQPKPTRFAVMSTAEGVGVRSPRLVERFWCQRDGSFVLDSDGFLRDPDASVYGGRSANPGALRRGDLQGVRCVVLLGEPGSGKSTAVSQPERLVVEGVSTICFDLAAYGSEDRLVREVFDDPAVGAWADGTDELCVVLDSLDEARMRIPTVGAIIADRIRRLPRDRFYLRIACRSADWLSGLEQSLKDAFGDVTVVEILPLRRVDAAEIALAWCEPDLFLNEVARANAGPLAARPLTLRFLARAFGTTGSFPDRGADLYAMGLRSLCEEQSPSRRDAGLHGALSLDERVAIARSIAAATVFGGAFGVWTGPETDAPVEDITIEALASTGSGVRGVGEVSRDAIVEVLRTGLFTSRGDQRLGWAHATFADYLAAAWVASNLTPEQSTSLLLGPDGRCWPQTRLVAAWVVAIAPEQFGFLATADPAAFQGEVELPGDALRAIVVQGLLVVAGTLTTAPWERTYRGLRHPKIAEQIRPHLRDTDPDRRRLALELADECATVELRDDLISIALDTSADSIDRVSAGWALGRLTDPDRTEALRPLALDSSARGDDDLDQLKGVGLMASWPHAMSTSEVFSVLTPARKRNFHGAYEIFIDRFRADLTANDVGAGLEWLKDLTGPGVDSDLGALANRLFELAASNPADPAVVDTFVGLVKHRFDKYEGLLFEDFRDDHGDPLSDAGLRRSVVLAVLATGASEQVLRRLPEMSFSSFGVIRADDLAWLAEIYRTTPDVRTEVRRLFEWTYDAGIEAHRELALGMSRDHPLHVDLIRTWVDPIDLASDEANEMRQARGRFHGEVPKSPSVTTRDEVNEWIMNLLDRFDRGEAMGFWQTVRLLTVAPGTTRYENEFDPDIAGRSRWAVLSGHLKVRLIEAAERYLNEHSCQPEQWLEKPAIRHFPAEAGYRAMLLLLRLAPDRLDRLPAETWTEWAPVLVGQSTASINGADWGDKLRLFEHAGPSVVGAARRALVTRVEAAVAEDRAPYAENEASYLWDETLASIYLTLARTAGPDSRLEFATTLAKRDFECFRPLLHEWVSDFSNGERQRLAARFLVDDDLESSWPIVRAVFDTDLTLAESALGGALHAWGFERFDLVSEALLADIYIWLRANFPPETDPKFDDAHAVGPRERLGHWRDDLLSRIRDRGTFDSVQAIRMISAALPDDRWLTRTLATAETALRHSQWSPTSVPLLLQLAADHRTKLVNDSGMLCTAVTAALTYIQTRLTGATPESHYLWDTYAGRPKLEDEISDYLNNALNQVLAGRSIVVNREVQIRRARPSGIGERTDLLVDALGSNDHDSARISVPVEVKGAWNSELLSAMKQQLVDRYMRDIGTTSGIYIVVWPDLESWTESADTRHGTLASLDRASVESELVSQAASHAEQGVKVEVVHLDISYRRPQQLNP